MLKSFKSMLVPNKQISNNVTKQAIFSKEKVSVRNTREYFWASSPNINQIQRRLQRKISRKYLMNKKGESYCKTRNIIKSEKKLLKIHHRLRNIRQNYRNYTDIIPVSKKLSLRTLYRTRVAKAKADVMKQGLNIKVYNFL